MKRWLFLWCLLMIGIVAGCDDDDIRVEMIPREAAPTAAALPPSPTLGTATKLEWTVPAGWTVLPAGGMRYAAFRTGTGQASAEMTIFSFPNEGAAGDILANVNRWRGQLQLPPTNDQALAQEVAPFQAANAVGVQIDLKRGGDDKAGGAVTANPSGQRMLAAIIPRPTQVWYFKLMGTDAAVAPQKPAFDAFVRSVKFVDAGGEIATTRPMSSSSARALPEWSAPPDWKRDGSPQPPRVASFQVGWGHEHAEVAINAFPGGIGDPLQNINRWRGQIGLPPIAAVADDALDFFEADGDKGVLIFLAGPNDATKPQAIAVGLIVHDQATWSFKMTGDRALVERERKGFEGFVRSVRFAVAAPDGAQR